MFEYKNKKFVINRTVFMWIISLLSWISSSVYSLETEEAITVNKAKTQQTWVRFSTDYVRCFCNLPQCVSTGYMCKSSAGGCFSDFLDHIGHHSRDYRGLHGCIELLRDKDSRALCEITTDSSPKLHKKKSLICCYHDMCNHIDNPKTKELINNTFLGEPLESNDNTHNNIGNLQQPIDYTNSQVWFRAATIAVPVCGAVILFVLIALAVKILRNENLNSTRDKLSSSYEPSQSKSGCDKMDILRKPHPKCLYHYHSEDLQRIQVPLLIQNEIATHQSGNKNETNAKLNLMQGERIMNDYNKDDNKTVVLDIEKVPPKCSKSNLINHVNNKFVDIKYVNADKLFINSINH